MYVSYVLVVRNSISEYAQVLTVLYLSHHRHWKSWNRIGTIRHNNVKLLSSRVQVFANIHYAYLKSHWQYSVHAMMHFVLSIPEKETRKNKSHRMAYGKLVKLSKVLFNFNQRHETNQMIFVRIYIVDRLNGFLALSCRLLIVIYGRHKRHKISEPKTW